MVQNSQHQPVRKARDRRDPRSKQHQLEEIRRAKELGDRIVPPPRPNRWNSRKDHNRQPTDG